MKVQGVNASSRKTRKLIKTAFAELINEKKNLNKITVTELVKKADITRSTFYTHYDDIYEVADDYQLETIELLISDDNVLHTKEDIYDYFDEITACLKKNEDIYRMLLSSNDTLIFLEKLKKMSSEKIYQSLEKIDNSNYLMLDVYFFMDGAISQLVKYFRSQNNYTLDELNVNIKKWFMKIFD